MQEKEFDRLLKVCRIELSGSERSKIKKDFEEILQYFNSISEVDTKSAKDAYHAVEIPEQLRADEPVEFEAQELILKNTKTYRFYVVGPEI